MTEVIKGEKLEKELRGRDALTDSIRLQNNDTEGGISTSDFLVEGVLHAGGSCICYRAVRFYENGDMAEIGTLKEFYPVDSDISRISYNLRRRDVDAGESANQLYSKELTLDNFKIARDEFYSAYKKISELKNDDTEYDNFFAPIVIYKGITPQGSDPDNHTIYIWNPGDNAMVGFNDYLKTMQKEICQKINNPVSSPDLFLAEKLRTIIQAIKALAIGIEKLHLDNLLHLDINPSNFGIRMLRKNDGDHITVSLYDINTVYSRSNPLARTGGTKGFRAPEITDDYKNNYNLLDIGVNSDIYSLGATLYNSIIILSEENRGIYDVSAFDDIDAALSHSLLIEPSEYNSKADLHDMLATILKRSLARRASDYLKTDNYESVGEFLRDLESADKKVEEQILEAKENGPEKKVIKHVVDNETYYDDKIDTGATGAMQCLLYDRPLYDYVDKSGKVNVLVLGAGLYSQKFLDIAFEMSQIKDCYLDVTVISNEKEKDEERYLSSRPEFSNYFWVNGNEPQCDDYGSIRFLNTIQYSENKNSGFSFASNNAEIAADSIGDTDKTYSYVFISLVDQYLNKKVAEDLALSDIIKASDKTDKAIINFVWYGKENKKDGKTSDFEEAHLDIVSVAEEYNIALKPAETKNTFVRHKDYNFIKRMAFNCHLLWQDTLNVDIQKTYGQFRSTYNFSSSLSMALSCKYKLKSIGLSLEEITNENDRNKRDDRLFRQTMNYRNKIGLGLKNDEKEEDQKILLNELTMYEHRRWNVNMICSSYKSMKQEEYKNLETDNKDKKNRKHPCLVPSKGNWSLNEEYWKDFRNWEAKDIENTENFKKLDPLDRMSVMLHKRFMESAHKFNFEMIENDAAIIRRHLYNNHEALAAFNAYLISMRAVMNRKRRNDTSSETYRHCSDVFGKFLKNPDMQNVEEIKKRLKNIETAFAPVRLAYDYTDYKEKDQRLIKGIPFILNYSTSVRICTPFVEATSENNNWFENVASSLVINPSILTYLFNIRDCNAIVSSIKDALFNVTQVMDNHDLQTRISLIIYTETADGKISDEIKSKIKKELMDISERIYNVEVIGTKNQRELSSRIRNTLETNQKSSSRFTAVELKGDNLSGKISEIIDPLIKMYEFNSAKKSFEGYGEERYIWFSDIPFNSYLNIEDMFIAHGRLSVYKEPELHRDYEKIWDNCYSDTNLSARADKTLAWKYLCSEIKACADKIDLIASIELFGNSGERNWSSEYVTVFVPSFIKASVERIIDYLKSPKANLVSSDSSVSEHNSAMVKVVFRSSKNTQKAVINLLCNPYILADSSRIRFVPISDSKKAQIRFDSLNISGLTWESMKKNLEAKNFKPEREENIFNKMKEIFAFLVKEGYIILGGQSLAEEELVFCFPSSQIKSLLTNEGYLLEIYTYYKTLEEGYFDEIKSGLEVQKLRQDKSDYISTQEFDLIAIKGFCTQFIEIKARGLLEQEFYQKLDSNGRKFGINKKLTLVSDFGDYSRSKMKEANKEAVVKGKEDYNVETIYGIQEIESIGKKLKEGYKE